MEIIPKRQVLRKPNFDVWHDVIRVCQDATLNYEQIADELNRLKVKTSRGQEWTRYSVRMTIRAITTAHKQGKFKDFFKGIKKS
jgi:hypothetical protein